MASIVSDMFSATAAVAVVSAVNLSNSFMNLMLSKLISRRNNQACLSVLENSAITLPSYVVQEKTAEEEAFLDKTWTNQPLVAQYERRQMFRRRLQEEF